MNTDQAIRAYRNRKRNDWSPRGGKVVAKTIIYEPPIGWEKNGPYAVVIVEEEKERRVGQLVERDTYGVRIGDRVKSTVRRLFVQGKDGVIRYGLKWRRDDEEG